MKGKKGPTPNERTPKQRKNGKDHAADNAPTIVYVLQCRDCSFHTHDPNEIETHLSGSGHGGYDSVKPSEPIAKPADLFSEPGPITRRLTVPYNAEELAILNQAAADNAMQLVEQKELAILARERIKALEVEQAKLVAKLRVPEKTAEVSCAWTFNLEENSKSLVRTDTNAIIETRALSQEDLQRERQRVEAANSQPSAPPAEQRKAATQGAA